MPKSQLTTEQRLLKYKISPERFDNESSALQEAGFTLDQAKDLILRQSSNNAVKDVLSSCKTLLAQPYALNHQQIINIASHRGGSNNIKAVLATFEQLKELGFNTNQVVKIVAHDGGSKNIEAVQTAFKQLKELGFNAEQVVKMVAHGGGSKNIKAVQATFEQLQELGFNANQVVKIVAHDGGSKNIEAVQAAFEQLKELGFNANQVAKIVGHDGGSKNIEAVQKHYQDFLAKGYSKKELISIVARNSGSKKIYAIIARNAEEDKARDFLYFFNTVLNSPVATETNEKSSNTKATPSKILNASGNKSTNFYKRVRDELTSDVDNDEEDEAKQAKRPKTGF